MIKRVQHYHKQEFIDSMCGYIESYDFYNEGIIKKLEDELQKFSGMKYALCVNSATNAIFMSLYIQMKKFKNFKPTKNRVIFPNYGFPAASKVCKILDLEPVPIDIEKKTLAMKPEDVAKELTVGTLAYINVETNGIVGYANELKNLMAGVLYIEDAAPSMLQTYGSKRAGTFGDIGIYSFSPTKPMCAGEGAVILTNDEYLYVSLKNLRLGSYSSGFPSMNFSMSPFLAAYLIPQISSLNYIQQVRKCVHCEYKKYLNIFEQENVSNCYGSIMYLSEKASEISKKLKKFDIEHRYKHYLPYANTDNFPVSKEVFEKMIELPIHHKLTNGQIKYICNVVRRAENG